MSVTALCRCRPSMSQESPLALSCADEAESPFIVALVQSPLARKGFVYKGETPENSGF